MASQDAKRGLGIMLEMTKTLGTIGLEVPKVDEVAARKAEAVNRKNK